MKVPAAGNILLNVAPGAIDPEPNDPSSPFAVWAVLSLLVHVTVPPAEIETGFGEYAVVVKVDEPLTIETGVPAFPDGEDGELAPQPMAKPMNPASMPSRNFMLFSNRARHRKGVATSNRAGSSRSSSKVRVSTAFVVNENAKFFLAV